MKLYIIGMLLILGNAVFAQSPCVENVRFEQRTDGTLLVDIYYYAGGAYADTLEITIEASDDRGATWTLPCTSLTGDVGKKIPTDVGKEKHVVWDFYADNPNTSGGDYRVRVTAYELIACLFVSADTTLVQDLEILPGAGFAIIIDAPNVTLDLGGHVISGDVGNGLHTGVAAGNVEGITIRNGTLEGFRGAVALHNTDNATIENLTIRNLDISDPESQITGISIGRSKDVVIRDVRIEFPPVMHKEAINLANCEITISNLEIIGCSVGVQFGGTATIQNSRFIDGGGILVASTSSAQISGNEFIRNECGIIAYIHGYKPFGITGVNVDSNTFHDCNIGISFWGIRESSITNNIIKNNGRGIQLLPYMFCDPINEPDSCFYATKNLIADNVVLGKDLDLFHHEKAVGNTWERNIFCTKQGDEIPDCNTNITTTAREALFSVNSAAAELATDAQLFTVNNYGPCDTTGKSCNWVYIYQSASQQSNYRFWFKDGQIINQDSVTENFEGCLPLPESWIDSDSAIVIADGKGGKEFRETFELQNIVMNLYKTWGLVWDVLYVAQDTTFSSNLDASME